MMARPVHRREQRRGSRRSPFVEIKLREGKPPSSGRRHAAGILGRADRSGLLGRFMAHRASMGPALQAFLPVFRCAAGAFNRDTGQAGLGYRGAEPWLTPNFALCRVRFHFAAGDPKMERMRHPRMRSGLNTLSSTCKFQLSIHAKEMFRYKNISIPDT